MKTLSVTLFAVLLYAFAPACNKSDEPDESTLPGCVAAHHLLQEVDAIAECLGDELALTFSTQAECEAYVTANGGFAESRVAACEKYFEERGADAGPQR